VDGGGGTGGSSSGTGGRPPPFEGGIPPIDAGMDAGRSAQPEDDDGCGCRVPARGPTSHGLLIAAALAMLGLRRVRRFAARPSR
jgi:MYXO-CTERM domain-containing protein